MIFLEESKHQGDLHNTRSPEGNEISAQLKPGGLRRFVKQSYIQWRKAMVNSKKTMVFCKKTIENTWWNFAKQPERWRKPLCNFSSKNYCLPRGLPRCFRDHSFSIRGWLVSWFCFRGASAIGRSASTSASASARFLGRGFHFRGPNFVSSSYITFLVGGFWCCSAELFVWIILDHQNKTRTKHWFTVTHRFCTSNLDENWLWKQETSGDSDGQ